MVYPFFTEKIISLKEIEDIFIEVGKYDINNVIVFDIRNRSLIKLIKEHITSRLLSKDFISNLNKIWEADHWSFIHDLEDILSTLDNFRRYDLVIINNDFMNKKALLEVKKNLEFKKTDLIIIKWGINPDKIEVLKKIFV
ncbi:hypothetical protein KKC17_04160 [Patescibacteria group bacterium]|nr:hypothetical protein [Patescibacteria group bacterium]